MPASKVLRRGIAMTPVKFGISFTNTLLNQAGALVHVYKDGTVQLNHGGTEMGQGLYIKVAQVVADELGISIDRIRINGGRHEQGAERVGNGGVERLGHERQGGADRRRQKFARG